MSLCINDRLVCRQACTPNGVTLYRVTYTRCRICTINSPDVARNMCGTEVNIQEKINVLQVGYLQGLYRVARSTEYKILNYKLQSNML